jgi:transketolase
MSARPRPSATGGRDDITLVACGITVSEAETAAEMLGADGVQARILRCYSVMPIDVAALAAAAEETAGIVTVEDHRPEGGLGEAVLSALADHPRRPSDRVLAVRDMPISGSPAELMHAAGIDAKAVAAAARELVSAGAGRPGDAEHGPGTGMAARADAGTPPTHTCTSPAWER